MQAELKTFVPLGIAVLTVSDTRDATNDRSGDVLVQRLREAGHHLADRRIVPDEIAAIRRQALSWIARSDVDAIITTGGTGFTGRDVTPQALEPLFERHMAGFSAMFHHLSIPKIGTSTVQSRATAGVAGGTFIFILPGSPGACKDGWDGILALQLDARHAPCNFVEILSRLHDV